MNGSDQPPSARVVRFGVFEVNLDTGELRREGRDVKLQEQPCHLLACLLERPGEMVTREELHARLWPDGSYVDFEQGLNTAIRKIRFALGDTAESPRFIQTLPRKGYRFIAPVDSLAPAVLPVPAAATIQPLRSRKWTMAFAAAALIAAVYWLRQGMNPGAPGVRIPVPLTSYSGVQYAAAFSPDGRQIAFAWDGGHGDNFDIYLKSSDSDPPTRLTTDPRQELSPAWSPDGRRIAFLRDLGAGRVGIMLTPAAGGLPVRISEVTAPLTPQSRNLVFTPDGNWIITPTALESRTSGVGLAACSVDTGTCRPLTNPGGGVDLNPALSSDGRSLAFLHGPNLANLDLHIVPLDRNWSVSGETRRLTYWNRFAISPAWSPDNREIILASGEYLRTRLWRVPASGEESPSIVAVAGDEAMLPAVAPNRSLAFSQRHKRVSIWSLDLRQTAPPQKRLARWPASSNRIDTHPHFSPDGGRVVFTSTRSGADQIWIANADGTGARQLTSMSATFVDLPDWSIDGAHVLFRALVEGHFDFYTISTAGGSPRLLMHGSPGDGAPKYSVDGRWIYFHSKRSGEYQIWRMPARGGPAVQWTRGGGLGPRESPDGQTLYFARDETANTSSLWRMPAAGGKETLVLKDLIGESFDVTANGIYYAGACRSDGSCPIAFYTFADGKSRELEASTLPGNNGLCLSPDGHTLLRAHISELGADIMVLPDFFVK
jgi:Tol biopolymer transport system component/DNA-binding winged helix-turn-helix (wHTH) protein